MLKYPDTSIVIQGAVAVIGEILKNPKDYETAPKIVSAIAADIIKDFNGNYPEAEKKDVTWPMIRATVGRVLVKKLCTQMSTK